MLPLQTFEQYQTLNDRSLRMYLIVVHSPDANQVALPVTMTMTSQNSLKQNFDHKCANPFSQN